MALNINTSTKNTYEYVPTSERKDKAPFTVTVRKLPLRVMADIDDSAITLQDGGKYEFNMGKQILKALEYGLIGWSNISDGKKPVKFRIVGGKASTESLEYLPTDLRTEIGTLILDITRKPEDAEELIKA